MPDPEQYIARDVLDETLRDLGYFLQARPKPKSN